MLWYIIWSICITACIFMIAFPTRRAQLGGLIDPTFEPEEQKHKTGKQLFWSLVLVIFMIPWFIQAWHVGTGSLF
jgi:hypothetical protein